MDCRIAKGKYEEFKCDALISLQYQDSPGLNRSLGKLVKSAYDSGHFRGVSGELFSIYPLKGAKAPRLIMVGLGKKANSNLENIRKAAGLVIRTVRKLRTVAYLPIDDPAETIGPLIDGAILGDYRFDRLKSDKEESKLKTAYFFDNGANVSVGSVKAAQVIAEGTCIARDLANLPANLLTPAMLAGEAKRLGQEYSIPVKVLDEAELVRLKMGALLGVAQGSANRPKMVIWEYKGGEAGDPPIVLVGKGVTFDSGGISFKPGEGMEAMKGDMGGAGAVISLIAVLGQIKPKD